MTWADDARASAARMLDEGQIGRTQSNLLHAIAGFCERHNVLPCTDDVNLWGFGHCDAVFAPADDGSGWWTYLHQLVEPLGMSTAELQEAFEYDRAQEWRDVRADTITWSGDDGDIHTLDVVDHHFVLWLFGSGRTPWAMEFAANSMDLFAHAALKTGLADQLGGVVRIDADGNALATGETLGDVLRGEDLPSEDEARARAFRGPGVAVDPGADR